MRTLRCKFVVLTGGPGAGKTAVMEAASQLFQENKFAVLPESASIVYSGGFPRLPSLNSKRAAQRAIFHVQNELERYIADEHKYKLVLCDRGIADGAAYWPDGPESFFQEISLSAEKIFSRYHVVIHLQTPQATMGYNNLTNPMRIETPQQAQEIDAKIVQVWNGHPNRIIVPATRVFTEKLDHVFAILRSVLHSHEIENSPPGNPE